MIQWQPQNEDYQQAIQALHRREAKLTHSQLVARNALIVLVVVVLGILTGLGGFHWLLDKILGAFGQ